jgi:hypothetical protein
MYPIPPLLFAMPCSHAGSTTGRPFTTLALFLLLTVATPVAAQESAVVRVEENIRAEPNGQIIGRVMPGSTLVVEGRSDRWLEVTFEGWVWLASLRSRSGGSFDLMVSEPGGENLRDEPRGRIAARLDASTLLVEEERIPGWARVRRTAWIWGPSVTVSTPPPAAAPATAAPPAASPPPAPETRWLPGSPRGRPVLSAPDGDTLARSAPGVEMQVVAREGNWVRVQLEGWVWSPEGADSAAAPQPATGATVEAVVADPARYRGRVVSWTLQFIALERAERVRTDFFEGEPYLLTRAGGADGIFVYVAVPPERLGDVQGLTPLERVRVVGRVRTGAAGLTGSPILDLVEIRREAR